MNGIRIITVVMIVATAAAGLAETGGRSCGKKGRRAGRTGGACESSLVSLPVEDLSDFERNSILHIREEEKLARDVYRTLGEKFDNPVFSNIPRSEQRHMDAMGRLLGRYGLDDPIVDGKQGEFSSSEMQTLYHELVAQGSRSEVEALKVGATIEDLDLHDLETALEGGVDNQDIVWVYRNLAKGSRNHMRAFMAQLKGRGMDYEARYMAQEDLDAIVDSEWERGPAVGQKRGCRNGRARGGDRSCDRNQGRPSPSRSPE